MKDVKEITQELKELDAMIQDYLSRGLAITALKAKRKALVNALMLVEKNGRLMPLGV